MVEVVKKDKETSEGLIRRFSRRMQESKVLLKARKSKFNVKKKSKKQLKEDALYRERAQKEAEKLKKMGIFDEEKFKEVKKHLN